MIPLIQSSFISGELSPSVLGRTDKAQYKNGASTMRNAFVRYTGGASSRPGLAYIGMCKQAAPNSGGTPTSNPPRDINFQYNINQGYALEFGDQYMRIKYQGAYVTEATTTISAATQATPLVITDTAHGYSNGDWIYIQNMVGMTNLNGLTWIVANKTTNTYQLTDLFGNAVSSAMFGAYISGGTASRIYTVVSPYAAVDLPYLKVTQNANTMNLVCWNQQTNVEYPPYNLKRNGQNNWVFTQVSFAPLIAPPSTVTATATSSTTQNTWYSYVVTAVDDLGNESVASANADVLNNDIAINAGSNTIRFSAVANATTYNVYAATPAFTTTPFADPGFIGATYGLIGSSFGQQFIDSNIIPDTTLTPPLHNNPFARGAVANVVMTAGGTGYTQSTVTSTITTSTGSGFSGTPIVQGGAIVGFIIVEDGSGYAATDTISFGGGGGTGASATLTVGPQTGTYPGAVAYYQQRLVYADTINQPDTYFMSRPALYANFDAAIPTINSDSIIGTPWGVQINGIQFLVPTINGLLTFTGNGVWLVNGGNSAAITPADQNAQAQAQIGCSALLPPLFINLHLLYVQAKNSIVRDIAYNFLYNVFQGTDITVFSNHLFFGYTLTQWAYAEEPFKIVWAVRNDGAMLSLTYVKEQEIEGWARHDTDGQFIGVCSVIEPPVDAVYVITKRYITGRGVYAYYSERMDNRQWTNVENCFCVDAGLSLPLTYPNAILTPAAANGTANISSTEIILGGSGYTNPQAQAVDPSGAGSGATFMVAQVGGVITSVTPVLQGQNYTLGLTQIVITDPTGSGAEVAPVITNYVAFSASALVFTPTMVGSVLRVGGGKATIVSQTSATCVANVTQALTTTVPNDPNNMPVPAVSGSWSVAAPVGTVSGLNHLEGMTVTGLADGGVITPQTVVNGSIALQSPASAVNVGLPFIGQLQSFPLDVPAQTTTQGKRGLIQAVTLRVEQTRGLQVGSNMPDASNQPNNANIPWTNMINIKDRNNLVTAGTATPLLTGDTLPIPITSNWQEQKQVAIQQLNPLPWSVTALIPRFSIGDNND